MKHTRGILGKPVGRAFTNPLADLSKVRKGLQVSENTEAALPSFSFPPIREVCGGRAPHCTLGPSSTG